MPTILSNSPDIENHVSFEHYYDVAKKKKKVMVKS
jgi:hypothetical protein